jgi:hypothetical protein
MAMRWPPLALAALAFPFGAHAAPSDDWCKTATRPSSLVICSDPELRALADERQQAFNDARLRVGEEGAKALWADQKRWVATYPVTCGITKNAPPPSPVPNTVRDCFKRAGKARIEYLRNYGTAAASTSSPQLAAPVTTPVELTPKLPPVYIKKKQWWCPYFRRYYPEAQSCPIGTWQETTPQDLSCRDATDPDDIAQCRRLEEQQRAEAREEMRRRKAEADAAEARAEARMRYEERIAEQVRKEKERGYQPITFEDFVLDRKEFIAANAKIAIRGFYKKEGGEELLLQSPISGQDDQSIALLTEDAPRDTRKYFLQCRESLSACPITVLGYVTKCTQMTLYGTTSELACVAVEDAWNLPEPQS